MTDLGCVARILEGDTAAGDALVERLRPLVVRIVRAHGSRLADEADLIQMAFLKVFANLRQFSGRVPLEHWVSRITVNVCLNQYRYEAKRPELRRADLSPEQGEVLNFLGASHEELSADRQTEVRELVLALMERLAPRERLIMRLLHLDGCSMKDVQQLTGMTNLAVRLVAFRARKKMKRQLQQLQQKGA
ncbi:MAG: RNA polymerase sigma factor [Planctomycetaceae bacterium]